MNDKDKNTGEPDIRFKEENTRMETKQITKKTRMKTRRKPIRKQWPMICLR